MHLNFGYNYSVLSEKILNTFSFRIPTVKKKIRLFPYIYTQINLTIKFQVNGINNI